MRLSVNLNSIDRVFRFSVGVICIYIGFIDSNLIPNQMVAVLIGIFGVTNIFAAFTSHCPVYAACGISTAKTQKSDDTGMAPVAKNND